MIKNIFFLAIILLLSYCTTASPSSEKEDANTYKNESLDKANDVNNLVLKEFGIARLDLDDLTTSFNEVYLESTFKDFDIKIEKFENFSPEGESFIYSATKNRSQVFTLEITSENEFKNLTITSPAIVDEYGVAVNNTVEQVKLLRTDLAIGKDDFFGQPTLSSKDSKISYLLSTPISAKDVYVAEDLNGLKVEAIMWKPFPTPY